MAQRRIPNSFRTSAASPRACSSRSSAAWAALFLENRCRQTPIIRWTRSAASSRKSPESSTQHFRNFAPVFLLIIRSVARSLDRHAAPAAPECRKRAGLQMRADWIPWWLCVTNSEYRAFFRNQKKLFRRNCVPKNEPHAKTSLLTVRTHLSWFSRRCPWPGCRENRGSICESGGRVEDPIQDSDADDRRNVCKRLGREAGNIHL